MLTYTKDTVRRILDAPGGLPDEFGWIDYKSAHTFDSGAKEKIGREVVSFLKVENPTLGVGGSEALRAMG